MVISGLLTVSSESPPARIVEGMLRAHFPFLLSLELLAEYRSVLLRRVIRSRHGLDDEEVETVLTEIAANGSLRSLANIQVSEIPSLDPGDFHLIRLLGVQDNTVLVTGDRRLERSLNGFRRISRPADFVALIEAE